MTERALHHVETGRQISVFLDDRPGTLGEVTGLLGEQGINVFALTLSEGVGHGYVRMVVDKPEEALKVLKGAEELTLEREVLLLEMDNAPGSLAAICSKLAEAGINIQYAYCAGGPSVDRGLVVVKVDRTEDAVKILTALA